MLLPALILLAVSLPDNTPKVSEKTHTKPAVSRTAAAAQQAKQPAWVKKEPSRASRSHYKPYASRGAYVNFRGIVWSACRRTGIEITSSDYVALKELAYKESKFNHTSRNPRSSAYGLFQFLNGTWRGTGIRKTNDPVAQTCAALIYIKNRYGTPSKALAHHKRRGWY